MLKDRWTHSNDSWPREVAAIHALRGNASGMSVIDGDGIGLRNGTHRDGDGIGLRIATPHLGKVVRRLSGVVDRGVRRHPLGGEQRGALSLSKIRESSEEYSLV